MYSKEIIRLDKIVHWKLVYIPPLFVLIFTSLYFLQ